MLWFDRLLLRGKFIKNINSTKATTAVTLFKINSGIKTKICYNISIEITCKTQGR